MIYDFVEIGTSDFDTLIEFAKDDTVGLSIEPIGHYLDALPNKPNVKKIKVAVSLTNIEETVEVFYLPESVIKETGIPIWLKGCNCIGKYHLQHYHHHGVPGRADLLDLVAIDKVPSVPIGKLLDENNVTGIKYLKLDTEGADCDILEHYYEYLKTKPKSYYPLTIRFESNVLTPADRVEKIRALFHGIGYNFPEIGYDTVLELL
jgi:hypothetical protein